MAASTVTSTLTIATRGSRLALWQAERVKSQLIAAADGLTVELLVIKTKGDKILDVPLAKVGGKGLFVKEIEEALLDGRADLAVHSMKDVPAELAAGLEMAATSAREDASDALVVRADDQATGLSDLKHGAKVGTSSLRRASQLLAARPDLKIAQLRGNVPTRVAKLDDGLYDAVILASAGLIRLGFGERITERLDHTVCLPAAGQGALGIEIRSGALFRDKPLAELIVRACGDEIDASRVRAERAFLARLGGGCQVPLAAHAVRDGEELHIDGLVATVDGLTVHRSSRHGLATDAEALGISLAEDLIELGADKILAELLEIAT